MKICKVDGCEKKHYARGYCSMHYQRVMSSGKEDLEVLPEICSVDGCCNKRVKLGYCGKHYYRHRRHGNTDETIIVGDNRKRLKNNCVISENGCWEWKKCKKLGYGNTALNGKNISAHRASWIVFVGDIPKGLQVNHKCHNRACINPEHLYLGTQKENMMDMYEAGRNNHPKGVENKNSKLNDKKVMEIRGMLRIGDTIASISKKFNVSESCIRSIKQRKTWRHVGD